MFGYVRPDKPELKIKDYEVYKGYYCGLCKKLKKEYTFFSRLFLNYDCTFLSIVLSAVSEEKFCSKVETCSFSPLKKKNVIYSRSSKYAAAINVLLARNSILDNIKDEKRYYLLPLLGFINRGYKKAKNDFPLQAEIIESSLSELTNLEKNKEDNPDKVADVFATMMGELLKDVSVNDVEAYYHIGYNLGRWIYLIDAFDDIEDDIKHKCYNPYVLKYGYDGKNIFEFKSKIKDEVEFSLIFTLSEVAKGFDLIKINKHRDLLENIIYSGVKKKTEFVLLKGEQK